MRLLSQSLDVTIAAFLWLCAAAVWSTVSAAGLPKD